MKIKVFFLMCLLAGFSLPCLAQADKIVGVYEVTETETGEVSKVEIYKTGNTYGAKVVWLAEPYYPDGTLKTDIKNPDPNLRDTPADKIVLITGLQYNPDKEIWEKGKVYHPVHGKFYKVQMEFKNEDTLSVRGYVGVPMVGMTVSWKKIS